MCVSHHYIIGVTNYGFAEKKNITGQGTPASHCKHAPRRPDTRGMQQLREPGHASPGVPQVRVLQGKTDPQAGRDDVKVKMGNNSAH